MNASFLIRSCFVGTVLLGRVSAAPSHDDSFTKEGLFKADAGKLSDTQMVMHPEVPIAPGQNVLWCGTFQLAWNEAVGLVGEKLRFAHEPPLVGWLNQESFTKNDLNPGSYVALADFERNHVEAEIRAALEKTFHGAASPELIPEVPPDPGPEDFVAYAYLYKNLAFATPFKDLAPLTFADQPVATFGFNVEDNGLPPDARAQVQIDDYVSEDDFIIEIKTRAAEDQLILAKVAPGATLQAAINAVLKRVQAAHPESARPGDELAVPKLNFDLRRDVDELLGLTLTPSPAAQVQELVVTKAKQLIRFQLNEKGAVLKSEATIAMRALAVMPRHQLLFNRPFLILMKQGASPRPYFALWVGNPTLLVKGKE